jgi:serine/threonine protein kinase
MRKIDLKYEDQEDVDLLKSQLEKLKILNHPHILKYHKTFTEDYNVYLILEYMNNGDLQSFIKAHQILGKKIKEEEIWNILLQCLSAIEYMRKEKLFEYGIKVTNIYLNNEQNIKLGLFYDYPKMEDKAHNIKEDILFLGLFFYKMCYSQYKYTFYQKKKDKIIEDFENFDENDENNYEDSGQKDSINNKMLKKNSEWNDDFYLIRNKENTYYSPELIDIVSKMIEKDINKRLSSEELYNIVRNEYVKKYTNNTSIKAVLRCLYSFPTFSKCIFEKEKDIIQYKEKYYIN